MNEMERKLFKKLSQRFTFFKLMQDGDFYIEIGDYRLDNIDYFINHAEFLRTGTEFDITIYSDDDIADSYIQLNSDRTKKSTFQSRFTYNESFFKELYDNGIEIDNKNYKNSFFLRKWRLDEIE